MRNKINLLAVGVITFVITGYSTYEPASGYGGGGSNLFLHGVAYFVLATALSVYFHDKTGVGRNEAAIFAALVGLLIEMHQFLLPYRTFSIMDAMVNSLGASIIMFDQRLRITENILELEDSLLHHPSDF